MAVNNKINLQVAPSDYNQNHYKDSNPPAPMVTTTDFYPEPSGALYRSNMVVTNNRSLIMMTNTSTLPTQGQITQWHDNPHPLWNFAKSAEHFKVKTKDVDFDNIAIRKKVHKVYVTFKAGGYMSGVIMRYATNGSTDFSGNTFANTTYYNNAKGFDSYNAGSGTSDWITIALKPSTSIKNIYSIQLEFSFANAGRVNAAQASLQADIIKLDTGASGVNDYYNGMPLYLFNDSINTDIVKVTNYVESTNNTNVSPDWIDHTTINSNTLYDVGFIPKEFAINDISIVYREKPVK